MTDQLILGIGVALVALLIAYEAVETWRWRGFDNRPPSRIGVTRFVRGAIGGVVSIVTLRRWRTRRAAPVPMLKADDVVQPLGDGPPGPLHLQPGRIVVSGAQGIRQPIQPVRPSLQPRQGPSRLRLVRDTLGAALIMGGFVVVFANLMPVRPQGDVAGETATPAMTSRVVTVSPLPPSASPASIASAAPDGAAATPALVSSTPSPTASPVSAAGPTARPQPTNPPPQPPTATPRPTPRPTSKPTPKPTMQPTPAPAPVVSFFSANTDRALPLEQVSFTFTCQNCDAYSINFGDTSGGSGDVIGGGASANHAYLVPGTYDCFLTVFNSEGAAVVAGPVTVTVSVP